MRRLLWALLLSPALAHAANFPISAGASTATIQSTINSAAAATGGNTVTFAAGSYSITSQINIPCPVSPLTIQGPVPAGLVIDGLGRPNMWPIVPTAILTNNGITNNWGFNGTACSTGTTIQYIEWNGNQPSGGGGGFMHVSLGMNNLTAQYNYFHGNMALQTTQQTSDDFFWLDGAYGSTHTQNTTLQWNQFGKTGSGDCGGNATSATGKGVMTLMGSGGGNGTCYSTSPTGYAPPSGASNAAHTCLYQGAPNNNSGGGNCGAFGLHTNTDHFHFLNNSVQEQEQGGKCFQNNGGTTTSSDTLLKFNDFSGIHRIGYEAQCNDGLTTVDSNDYHDPYFIDANSWALSLPQGNTISTSNVVISNVVPVNDRNGNPPSWAGDAIEAWGNQTSSNNLIQGKWNNGILYGFHSTPFSVNNNIIQMTDHSGYIVCCDQGSPNTPTVPQSGNVTGSTLSSRTSVAPTISPAAGAQTYPLTVTLTDPGYTSGAGPQGNTGIWYTTDGSTPVPGSGTAKYLASGQTFSLASAATVKAVGMWGALNQPASYASGYGFVPSAVQSAAYTGGGTPAAATPALSPATESFYVSASVSITDSTPSSTIYYTTNGSTPTTSSPVYTGPITVTATTTIQAIAAASGFLNSAVGSGTYTLAIPPLTGCQQTNAGGINSMAIGGTAQQIAQCLYAASGETLTCSPTADKYGDVATAWGTSGGAITVGAIGNPPGCGAGLNGPGCVTGVSAATANSTLTVGANTCAVYGWTITNSPPTLLNITISLLGGGTAVNVGSTVQACANMFYTGAIQTQVCGAGSDAYGTSPSNYTSSTGNATMNSATGVLTGVSMGSTNISVQAGAKTAPPVAISVNTPITGVSATFSGAQLSGAQIQ